MNQITRKDGVYCVIKSIKLRIYPNKTQLKIINNTLGACNFVKNKFLEYNKNNHAKGKKFTNGYNFSKIINKLKKDDDITELLESIENMYEEIEIPSSFNVYMRFWFKHIMKSIKETWFDIYFDAVEITYTDGMQYKHPISYQIHTLKAFYEVIHRIHTERQNDDDN